MPFETFAQRLKFYIDSPLCGIQDVGCSSCKRGTQGTPGSGLGTLTVNTIAKMTRGRSVSLQIVANPTTAIGQ